jgi:hypothetical protein
MVLAALAAMLLLAMPVAAAPGQDPAPGPGPNDSGKFGPADEDDAEAGATAEGEAFAYTSPTHVFTLDDVIGNGAGETDADNPNVIKDGDPGETLTGEDDLEAKDGSGTLHPINSEFGYDVQDFVGATPKTFDTVAEEGWVGELATGGLQFSDADTAVLKSGNLIGTWAAGLGGTEIKASTEHFTVMEAVLSCYQTIPYEYWSSAEDHAEGLPSVPSLQDATTCANNQLPNPVTTAEVADAIAQLDPNEDSIIPGVPNLYLGSNYSVTEKDDGKVLYRWGQAVKRPTDIRFRTTLPLPEEWKAAEGRGFKVTKAELVLNHNVTNNPNDQIRPEDWENEGATGVLPGYTVAEDGTWRSTRACYEGDGDFIPEGTLLRDPSKALPTAASSDLVGGFSNAWYTTIDRNPFAWAYRTGDGSIVSSDTRDDSLGELVSGPRWRMLSNKFGQDIPSLEIPAEPCDEPPYEKGTVKYEVGDTATTTINLLDWSTDPADARWDDAASPLTYSAGWMTSWSGQDTVAGQKILPEDAGRCATTDADGTCVTDLGTKLTDGFDVSFYVKGDKKPLQVKDVTINLEYEAYTPPAPAAYVPFASWEDFVTQQFVDLTGKAPTATELATWVADLEAGSSTRAVAKVKGDLITALRRGTDNVTNVDPVVRLYRAYFLRAPDAGGLDYWVARRRNGTWSLRRISDYFAASNEFKTKYGTLTNTEYVTRLYTDVLGRAPDPTGLAYWVRQLDLNLKTRGDVMLGFSESSEFKRKQLENTDVAVSYIFLLDRAAKADETTDWVTRQKAGTTLGELATELLEGDEYADRVTA